MDFGGGLSQMGSGIGGIIAAGGMRDAAQGYRDAAASLTQAAGMERTNRKISDASTELQKYGLQRSVNRAVRGIQSDQFGAGFTFTGSGLDVARDSTAQGQLGKALIQNQGAINAEGYEIQAVSYEGQAKQALAQAAAEDAQASASEVSGMFSIVGGIFSMFSDPRMKEDKVLIGKDAKGFNVYEFSYKGSPRRWRGYMADELPADAVINTAGLLGVTEPYKAVPVHG